MTEAVYNLLQARKESAPRTKVFPGNLDRHGRTTPLSRKWARMMEHIPFEGRLHDLRHTFASRLVQRGASIQAVQELLGHATLQMTMRYAHLAPDNLRSAIDLLDRDTGSGFQPQLTA